MKCVCSGDGSGGSAVCPLCHVICRATNIIENHFLVESLPAVSEGDGSDSSKLTELKCGSCPDTAATSWCVECAEFICDGCVQAHQRLKITKEHTIKPKEEGEPDNQAPAAGPHHKSLFCSVHRQDCYLSDRCDYILNESLRLECELFHTVVTVQEKLSLFCETCDCLTCRDCQLSDHCDHFLNESCRLECELYHTVVNVQKKLSLFCETCDRLTCRDCQLSDHCDHFLNESCRLECELYHTVVTVQEKLSLFCETCDRLTCRDCQLSDHRDHKYKFINEIAAETRNMISGLLSEVR
ncbi:hypothetical protein J6590_105138 [Homalodisca vitripennis]|nr:hypothetical protein J6590_105138 [Homalodisca vitripennis]